MAGTVYFVKESDIDDMLCDATLLLNNSLL
jgi:hypothetical protein